MNAPLLTLGIDIHLIWRGCTTQDIYAGLYINTCSSTPQLL